MLSSTIRSALRSRAIVQAPRVAIAFKPMSIIPQQVRLYSSHHEETFEEFTERYVHYI